MAQAARAVEAKKKSTLPKGIALVIAVLGCVIAAVPAVFGLQGDPAPVILIGCGVTVVALGIYLFFSI
jgi:protein-S-isoprenylcysteine O-methyltransferase Ste14